MNDRDTIIIDCDDYAHIRFPEDLASRIRHPTVYLKPNISTKNPYSYTNSVLVRALADFLSAHGFVPVIVEGMHLRKFKQAVLQSTGYASLMRQYEFVDLEDEKCRVIDLRDGRLNTIAVPELLFREGTTIINIPKLKTHLMTLLTGPVKNISMGIVNQHSRAKMHRLAGGDFELLCDMMIDVYEALSNLISFTMVDAVEIMVGNGPSFGQRYDLNRILVGDAVALEWECVNLLNMKNYPMTKRLEKRNLRAAGTSPAAVRSVPLPDTYRRGLAASVHKYLNLEYWGSFVFSDTTIRNDWHLVEIDGKACTRCGECIRHCPSNAISDDYIIDASLCNRCLCCVENCPNEAVRMKTSTIMRILDRWGSRFY